MDERTFIQLGLMAELKPAQIALELSRSASTITRGLKRNDWVPPVKIRSQGRPFVCGGYKAVAVQDRARALHAKPKVERRLKLGNTLWGKVMDYLKLGYSPEQIAGTLKLINPNTPLLQVSHETIYTAIYAMPRGELRTEVVGWLRHGHAKRRPRARGEDRRGLIPDMVNIPDRSPELAKTEAATAESAMERFAFVLNRIEGQKRLSMTYDQDKEMSDDKKLTLETGMKVYFADPHSPCKRGINENTNGLVGQYFPKRTGLSGFSQEQLDEVAWQLKTRSRKSMGVKCYANL